MTALNAAEPQSHNAQETTRRRRTPGGSVSMPSGSTGTGGRDGRRGLAPWVWAGSEGVGDP